jgi:hypothetical protein
MTNEEILKLAETCDFIGLDDDRMLLCCDDELLKFARAIYSEGFSDGRKEGSYSDYIWMKP